MAFRGRRMPVDPKSIARFVLSVESNRPAVLSPAVASGASVVATSSRSPAVRWPSEAVECRLTQNQPRDSCSASNQVAPLC
jgi:hypothetical protein